MLVNMRNRAEQDLNYIRAAMDRAEGASSVSGLGGMFMGVVGFAAAVWTQSQPHQADQLLGWIAAAFVAVLIGGVACVGKARRSLGEFHWDPVRRFLLCLLPSLVVGALLTGALWQTQTMWLVPAVWLLCYGCGVVAAGSYAVLPVRLMGACFMLMGVAALILPGWFNQLLVGGFGGLHLVFGAWVYKKYGG